MIQQNAFERIAELEGKLKIATENAVQAVKERNILQTEVFDLNDAMYARTSSLMKERDELREAILELGYLTGTEGYCGDHVVLTVRLNPLKADKWNALVAKLRTEEGKP